tara:strand:- start:3671 stop:5203 length:1533 start_codon:yes stop_codon:yes gene_type:complete
MPLDYTVPLPQFNVAPVQNTGPLNMMADVLKLQGLQRDQQLNQLKMQEYVRARGDASAKRAEELKTKADLERIYGGISAPAGTANAMVAPSAPANAMVAPAVPQMGFGAGAGEYTPATPAPSAAAAAAPSAASASAPGAPNYAGIITELVRGGHIEEAKKMADLAKSHTETRGKEYENSVKQIDAAYAPLQALTNRVQSPADVAAYTQMLYNDPVLGPQAAKIKPLDQAIADSQREFAANPQQWQLAHSKVDGKVIYDAATNSVAPKIVAKDVGGSIKYIDENPKSPTFMKEVGDFAKTLSPAQGAKEMPPTVRLAQGEVWNKEAGRVDAVPGSAAYIKRSQEHAGDVTALNAVKEKTDEAIVNITKMLSDENKEGFQANFGGMGTTVTSRMAGKPKDFKGMLDTFKSNMKSAGLELIRSGGSIGAMTEKEWPIVEAEMASLDGWMTEENARNVMKNVAARLARIKKSSENVYDMTWSETQFHPKNKKSTNSSADDITAADAIIGIGKGN